MLQTDYCFNRAVNYLLVIIFMTNYFVVLLNYKLKANVLPCTLFYTIKSLSPFKILSKADRELLTSFSKLEQSLKLISIYSNKTFCYVQNNILFMVLLKGK